MNPRERLPSLCLLMLGAGVSGCGTSQGASTASNDAGKDGGAHDASAHHADAGTDAHPRIDASSDASPDGLVTDSAVTDAAENPIDAGPPNPCLPFSMPLSSVLFASTKQVFAHYFYPFPLSIGNVPSATDYYNVNYLSPTGESNKWLANGGYLRQRPLSVSVGPASGYLVQNMQKEVTMAMAAGITGFTVDILGTDQTVAGSQLQNLLLAAAAVDSRFKIVVMPDVSALGANASAIEAVISSVASSPAAYHLPDGRLVVSAFDASLAPVSFWTSVFSDLSGMGIDVAFVPTFLGWSGNAAAFSPISYGLADWGTATPSAAAGFQSAPAAAHGYGEIFMLPILSQQYRPKDFIYWEAGNSLAFRNGWTSAIAGGADWAQIVTWSDFSESGEVEPYTDATLAGSVGTGFYDLNAYYASWFLTGQEPTITHDVLYYFYRREPVGAAAPAQTTPTTLSGGVAGQNNIELLAFLTAPGTLSISSNGQVTTQQASAGLTSFTVPLASGTPEFALTRGGAPVIAFAGKTQVYDAGGLPSGTLDLTYWTGSASVAGVCELSTP